MAWRVTGRPERRVGRGHDVLGRSSVRTFCAGSRSGIPNARLVVGVEVQ